MLFLSFLPLLFSFLVLCVSGIPVKKVTISTLQGFIDFSNNVNSGTSYLGTTVYLDSDLDFSSSLSSSFEPIGINTTYPFQGIFDGKGYVISNLTFSGSFQYVGIFGYLNGAIIKNIILSGSCSIVSSYSRYNIASHIGSLIGYCYLCTIENIVNMASVTFAENSGDSVHLGGIAGKFSSSNTARNCVNYGSVTHSGKFNNAYIGGIVGNCENKNGFYFIQNCANYGTLSQNETTGYLYMGGIVGSSLTGTVNIENCVSAGKILNLTSGTYDNYIGSVIGYINTIATNITHCMWTSDVGCDTAYSHSVYENTTVTYSSLTELNTASMNEMNSYAEKDSTWDKWFILHLNGGKINNLIQEALIVTQKYFPDPVKNGRIFLFWCTDTECAEKYNSGTDITGVTDLYALWDKYTVTFVFGNETKTLKNVKYGEKYGELPEIEEKEGYTFNGWFTEEGGNGEEITSETIVTIINDHALYEHWTVNNYTLTFIFDNGTDPEKRILNYNDVINYPNDPVKEGYLFIGWVNNNTIMPAHNLNITAQWTEITEFVEIVFVKKDMKEEEIKEIIKEYTDNDFAIEKITTDEETGELKVIIKFYDDSNAAAEFIRIVNENKRKDDFIKRVEIISYYQSFSPVLFPFIPFSIFV